MDYCAFRQEVMCGMENWRVAYVMQRERPELVAMTLTDKRDRISVRV